MGTEPQTIESLLRQWAELEPEWAKIGIDTIPPDSAYHIGAWAHAGYYVQIVVQQAIEARGWLWEASRLNDSRGKYEGVVYDPAKNNPRMDEDGRVGLGYSNDTPAAALLSAYLKALKYV